MNSNFSLHKAGWYWSCGGIERELRSSITILLDGFVVMCTNKPDISYKPEVCKLHIPTCAQLYMCKYTPGGTFDVSHHHSVCVYIYYRTLFQALILRQGDHKWGHNCSVVISEPTVDVFVTVATPNSVTVSNWFHLTHLTSYSHPSTPGLLSW